MLKQSETIVREQDKRDSVERERDRCELAELEARFLLFTLWKKT